MSALRVPRGVDRLSRERATLLRRIWIVVEFLLVATTMLLVVATWYGPDWIARPYLMEAIAASTAAGLAWSLTMYSLGAYHSQRFATLGGVVVQLGTAHGVASLVGVAMTMRSLAPAAVAPFLPLSLALLLAERATVMAALRAIRRRGGQSRRLVLVASAETAAAAEAAIRDRPDLGLRLVEAVEVESLARTSRLLERTRADELIIADLILPTHTVANAALEAQLRGVNVRRLVDRKHADPLWIGVGQLNGGLVATLFSTRGRPGEVVAKRLVDILGATLLLVVSSPVMAAAWLAIAVSGGRPVYRQERVGRLGTRFTMYKFRTMAHDADARRTELAGVNTMTPPVFKASNDPRVTRIGRLLRRWSIDELPQLLNVLRGEMSLVGPRPARPYEVAQYETWQKRRLCVKPGLTGPWQVAGRGEVDFADWMRLDAEYVNEWTMWRDLQILVRTVPTIISGRGAH